ncbi:MAG: type II secretion system secretin GspD [Halothiobacillaceae bacterium]|nr:type II secretion system secretin GspD [Halothiobacillaceae bacterium]MDY0049733.1 type II secretion system secretin GspD [Halothiobacillaceae bacterium]
MNKPSSSPRLLLAHRSLPTISSARGPLLACLLAALALPVQSAEVTLNLKDADIEALITTVSEVTGKNFVVDPRVKARINVVSAKPMGPNELYDVFLSVLQVHGFAAIPAGSIIKIVPEVNAKGGGAEVVNQPSALRPADEMVTEVVTLRHVAATPLMTILRQIMPQQAAISAHNDSNSLVITDRAGNIARLKEILQLVDRPDNNDIEIIALKHASAADVVKTLQQVSRSGGRAGGEGGAAPGAAGTLPGGPVYAADERTNSVLISGPRDERLKLRTLVAHLDTPLERAGNTQVFYLKYAKAKDLVNILQGVRVMEGAPGAQQGEGKSNAAAAGFGGAPRSDATIQADESINALVITAAPNVMREMESVIKQLDIRRAQVLVEAVIAEVSDDFKEKLGVQLVAGNTSQGPIGVMTFNGLLGTVAKGAASAGTINGTAAALAAAGSLGDGLNMALGRFEGSSTDFGVLISALAADAGNNILSTPSLLTLDNEEASIVVGQNIPLITGSYASTGSSSSPTNPFQTVSRQDVGVKLKVKPTISPDNAVKMEIEQEVSSLDKTVETSAGFVTNKRNVTTRVQVDDGDVVILGGLIDETAGDTLQKVPGLGDIPLLGELFTYRDSKKVKRNLMVFIRPIIVRDREDISRHTAEKYNMIRNSQLDLAARSRGFLSPEQWPTLPDSDSYLRNVPGTARGADAPQPPADPKTERPR